MMQIETSRFGSKWRGRVILAVLVIMAGMVYLARCNWPWPSRSPLPRSGQLLAIPASASLDRLVADANKALGEALSQWESRFVPRAESAPGASAGRVGGSGCDWEHGVRRTGVSLVSVFLMGSVKAKLIMRHQTLNVLDRPFCPDEVKALDAVLDDYKRLMAPVLSAFRDLRMQECIAMVDRGEIDEWVGSSATDGDVARYATLLEKEGESPGQARTDAENARLSLGARPQVSYLIHGGKCYLRPPAESLPRSVAFYEQVKVIAANQMQVVVAWFEANGLVVNYEELRDVYVRMSAKKIE